MLLVGGENVYPTELENVLAAHPAVQQAAVFGAPNAVLGELPHACVTLRPAFQGPRAPSAAELLTHCRGNLSGYKVPVAVHILESFPVTGSGKVQKRALREQMLLRLGIPLEDSAAAKAAASSAGAKSSGAAGGGVKAAEASARRLEKLVWAEPKGLASSLGRSPQPGQRWLVLADSTGVARQVAFSASARGTFVSLPASQAAAAEGNLPAVAVSAVKAALSSAGEAAFDAVVIAWPLDWISPSIAASKQQQQFIALKAVLASLSIAGRSRSAKVVFLSSPGGAALLEAAWGAFCEEKQGQQGARQHIQLTDVSATTIAAASRLIAAGGGESHLRLSESAPEILSASPVAAIPAVSAAAGGVASLLGGAECLVISGDWEQGTTARALASELMQASTAVKCALFVRTSAAQGQTRAAAAAAALALEIAGSKRVIVASADASNPAQLRMALRATSCASFALLCIGGKHGRNAAAPFSAESEGLASLEAAFREGSEEGTSLKALLAVAIGGAGDASAALLQSAVEQQQLGAAKAWHVQLRGPVTERTKEAREILSALAASPGARCVLTEPFQAAAKVATPEHQQPGIITKTAASAAAEHSGSVVSPPPQPEQRPSQQSAAAAGSRLRLRIREAIEAVLDLDDEALQDDVELWQSGLSSTLAVSAAAQIQAAVGVELPATLLFDFPTVSGLSAYIMEAVQREEARRSPPQQRASAAPAAAASFARRRTMSDASLDEAADNSAAAGEEAVAQAVRAAVVETLQIDDSAALTAESSLWDYGLSSAAAVGIAGALEQALGREMPATLVFDYGTIGELTSYVASLVGAAGGGSKGRRAAAADAPAAARSRSASGRKEPSSRSGKKSSPPAPNVARLRLVGIISEVAAKLLGVDSVEPNEPLWSLGLNSLAAVQLSQALGTALQAELPATLR